MFVFACGMALYCRAQAEEALQEAGVYCCAQAEEVLREAGVCCRAQAEEVLLETRDLEQFRLPQLCESWEDSGKSMTILTYEFPSFLPERWYGGDHGKKPEVRSQGKYGTCWALTAASALETSLLPEEHIVFSADHIALKNAFATGLNDGGNYLMTMAYLSGWQGPVTEEEDPYGDAYSPDGLLPEVHVQEMQLLQQEDPETVKAAVMQYGAVQTSLFMDRSLTAAGAGYYIEETSAYYYPKEQTPNHDVLILGWDDSFSRFYFAQTPDRDGAFICQNSWGSEFGEDGIFYVSYSDPNIAQQGIVYTGIENTDNYDMLYQNDDCGWQGRQGYGDETCWIANVYTAQEEAATAELLAAVGFYATGRETTYEVWLVDSFDGTQSFAKRRFLKSGTLPYAGYYTVKLDEEQALAEGGRFAVLVKLTTPGSDKPAAVEYRADRYTQEVTTKGREGYLSGDGERWEQTEERFGTNVCLKAYTNIYTSPRV